MGGSTSIEVKESDPDELSAKSKTAKCAPLVSETIVEQGVDGGTAYEYKSVSESEPDEFKEILRRMKSYKNEMFCFN